MPRPKALYLCFRAATKTEGLYMRYIEKTKIEVLRNSYQYLVGWAPGIEFYKRYNPNMYKLDFMIDGLNNSLGEVICGIEISPASILEKLKDEKTCVIIYHNAENEILDQIHKYAPNVDTIISRLLEVPGQITTYSANNEDLIMMELLRHYDLQNFSYLDIGVCHPVVRNNTFLFYEQGFTNGVLVEPNPLMCDLAPVYRPENRIVRCGACAGDNGSLKYYVVEDRPGYNTFSNENAKGLSVVETLQIPVININQIVEENFETYPDVLDIDTEGMDYDLLNALNFDQYKIKIICVESLDRKRFRSLLSGKGYMHFMSTNDNDIFVLKQ